MSSKHENACVEADATECVCNDIALGRLITFSVHPDYPDGVAHLPSIRNSIRNACNDN